MVSNNFNKHGSHAFSTFSHTRHFFPIGNGIKINHFFPGKDYHYQEPKNYQKDEKESKAEKLDEDKPESDEPTMVLVDADNKMMLLDPMPVVEPKEITPILKTEEIEAPVKVMPVISMIMQNKIPTEISPETVPEVEAMSITEKTETRSPKELVEINQDQKKNEEPSPDSEVASSYYHSRIYYVGY